MVKISQAEHFQQTGFGMVLRSSAIFYYRQSATFQTRFSVLNYWQIKRGLTVMLVASLRDMNGQLCWRETFQFKQGAVWTICPAFASNDQVEGSWELEAFSHEALVIPYAAIMAFYETLNADGSVRTSSAVHSYTRTYSPHEVEEGRTITHGEEGCWTLRDAENVRSFAVLHNGSHLCPAQSVSLTVQNKTGQHHTFTIDLPAIKPYQSVRIEPQEHWPDLVRFLDNQPGFASLSFHVEEAFTRLLVGNHTLTWDDCQVTHSNFNYSQHETDVLGSAGFGIMQIPELAELDQVLIYPHSSPGTYQLNDELFNSGQAVFKPAQPGVWQVSQQDGAMPTRLVTALTLKNPAGLTSECSLGIVHAERPLKHFWWLPVMSTTRIILTPIVNIYGKVESTSALVQFSLYRDTNLEAVATVSQSLKADITLRLTDLFPVIALDTDEIAWITVQASYGGHLVYGLYQAEQSVSLEHGF